MKEEPVDVLDEKGRKTGKSVLKSQAHKRGLWHGAAHLWIYNPKGEILLQRRHPDKIVWPNIWDVAVAGHIAAGETPEQTIVTEAQEEIGIKIAPKETELIGIHSFEDMVPPDNWLHKVFIWSFLTCKDLKLDDLVLEEGETSEARWVSYGELKKEIHNPALASQFSPRSKILFEEAINTVRKKLEK